MTRILDEVGLPADAADRYPREFSGGQRQRLALARALIQRPALIIADEPVSALDVSVQAQILNLMRKLQRQYGLSYLFISHDLSVIRYMADTIGVMYFGKIVEIGPAEDICTAPAHPYTAGLIEAVPAVTGEPLRRATTVAPRRPGSAGEDGPTAAAAAVTQPPGAAGSGSGARSRPTSAPNRSRRCVRICRQVSWWRAISRLILVRRTVTPATRFRALPEADCATLPPPSAPLRPRLNRRFGWPAASPRDARQCRLSGRPQLQ